VREAFDDPRFADAGFGFSLQLPAGIREVWLEVSACSARGERALLFAGPVAADGHV